MNPTNPIWVRGLTVDFGDFRALANVSFEVRAGEVFGLIGPSGCGKTTTLRLLTGNLRPTEGEARVLEVDPARFSQRHREQIGYLTQHFVLYPDLSLYANLNFVASIYGLGFRKRRGRIKQTLEFVELWDRRNVPAGQASGGMQRRLGLASALVHDPSLIFLDEPTAGIDPVLRSKFWDHFAELKSSGRTLFVTTQYVTEAEYCDRVAVLSEGRLIAVGTPNELRHQALGGELLDIWFPGVSTEHSQALAGMDVVRWVQPRGANQARLVVEEASSALPAVLRLLQARGGGTPRVEEFRPNFDEVFVALIEQDRDQRAGLPQAVEAVHV